MLGENIVPILGFEVTTNDDPQLDGMGLTIFCSGCMFDCNGCQNPTGKNPDNGIKMSLDDIKSKIKDSKDLVKSVTFCGGEFTLYPNQLKELSKYCKDSDLKTILYTGNLYENLDKVYVDYLDIVVDGPYNEDLRQNIFPATRNQRVWVSGKLLNNEEIERLPINGYR